MYKIIKENWHKRVHKTEYGYYESIGSSFEDNEIGLDKKGKI